MDKKQIRQMNSSLLRRLTVQPAVRYIGAHRDVLTQLVGEQNYIQRFVPLFDGKRLRCADVLERCKDELALFSVEPEEGWLAFAYDFARRIMFPEPGQESRRERHGAGAVFFLSLLQVLLDAERTMLSADPFWQLELLEEEELSDSSHQEGYRQFLRSYRREYVYEMMRLGLEVTDARTLEHVALVHHVAMSVARELKQTGVPVDLALVSAAAAGHDLGVFGCQQKAQIAPLHYYYTERWFHRRHMDDIGYVAANHSVGELEPDHLSVESLVLIYANFRVVQELGADGRENTRVVSLTEALEADLRKLDDVVEEKRQRSVFTHAKIRDFEQYMIRQGVDVSLMGNCAAPAAAKDVALLNGEETVERLKELGVEHSIALMGRLTGQRSFANLLELARSETEWKKLRAYLEVFSAYSAYLSIPHKVQLLAFLYELLMHREGDIRRQAADLMGEIIAAFRAGYAKEHPVDIGPDSRSGADMEQWKLYLEKIIHPDHKLMSQHKRWLAFTLKMVVNSLLERCCDDRREAFLTVFLRYYRNPEELEVETAFLLLETAAALPMEYCSERQCTGLLEFAQKLASHPDLTVRAAVVELLGNLRPHIAADDLILHTLRNIECGDSATLCFVRAAMMKVLDESTECPELNEGIISEIFLDNLKISTPWIIKEANIRLLADYVRCGRGRRMHIATHLSNLVKVSDQVTVRHCAGNALVEIAPSLTIEERSEVAMELCHGVELGQLEFSKYIPDCLGRFCLWLPPAEIEGVLGNLGSYLCSHNDSIVTVALDTVGVIYETYDTYRLRFPEEDKVYRRRRERLLGMLLKGLAGVQSETRQESMYILGRHVFGSKVLGCHEKSKAFRLTMKKILSLIVEDRGGDLTFYYRSTMLSQLCRYITEQELLNTDFQFEEDRPIAFFPVTFDPFTQTHKGIVQAIRDMGYEVLLAIDEFSWSKRTQPHRVRRRIVRISVADEFHVHVFPENFPVNVASPDSLAALRAAFPGRKVVIVAGSDDVATDPAYRQEKEAHSIHTFDHIVFRKGNFAGDYSRIDGSVLELDLPEHLEDISPTMIRDAIDQGRDISQLVDPVALEMIYTNGMYQREPWDKPVLQAEETMFHHIPALDDSTEDLLKSVLVGHANGSGLCRTLRDLGEQLLLLRSGPAGEVLGFASFQCVESNGLYSRLGSTALTSMVRQNAGGRTLVISSIVAPRGSEQLEICQLLVTEVLTLALRQEYTYALFLPADGKLPVYVREILALQGFVPVAAEGAEGEMMAVDMQRPIVINRNVDAAIKEPFATNPRVVAVMANAHRRLQRALTGLYPGCLVLSISSGVVSQRLLRCITACNEVPVEIEADGKLGECICVPFGEVLRGVAIPNTVTKTMHTDKVYEPDLSSFVIEAHPHYSTLATQVRMIRAFDRPVILVEDMLHDGHQIRRIAPLLKENGTQVRQVLVGYLTGTGRDLMEELGYPVDSVYYLPRIRMSFAESALYPFVGGDAVRRSQSLAGRLQPVVNRIFPYAAPDYLEDCTDGSTYKLSLCCLENARDILLALEAEYRALYARNLTLGRLREVFVMPLCPDKGSSMTYDSNRAASTYLDNDIEVLRRLKANVRIVIGE